MALAEAGDAGTSGSGVQVGQGGRLRELPRECMLAAARPDEEDSHRPSLVSSPAPQRPADDPQREAIQLWGDKVSGMDDAGFQRWLGDYVEAWRTYEVDAIGEFFSEDVEYPYPPWDEPVRGRAAVVEDWLEERDEPHPWA